MIMQRARCHSELACLLGIFWLLPYVCTVCLTRKRNGSGCGRRKVCGRNYSQFWQGLLSTPICESGPRSLAKHNISSILSQWQANIIEQRFFFPNAPFYCWLPPRWIEWLKPMGVRLEKRKSVRRHGSRSWVLEKKREKGRKKKSTLPLRTHHILD